VCLRLLALTGSIGAPNIAQYQSLRRHKRDQMKISLQGVHTSYQTFNFEDEIWAGGGRSGVYSACYIAHYSVISLYSAFGLSM